MTGVEVDSSPLGDEPGIDGVSFTELTTAQMCAKLESASGIKFTEMQKQFESRAAAARTDLGNSKLFHRLNDLHAELTESRVAGKIRGVEAWADGTDSFKLDVKTWSSFIDKLYRINIEDNDALPGPPSEWTIHQRVPKEKGSPVPRWVDPTEGRNYVDDLIRTKFVVPFADGVTEVSDRIKEIAVSEGLSCYRRYHAKDSGYHAHHVYVIVPVFDPGGETAAVAFEIKVLTKLQDTLGELTHLLYELKRTRRLSPEKKRKLAWMFDHPDFTASYVGHTAHYMEALLVGLKTELNKLEGGSGGES